MQLGQGVEWALHCCTLLAVVPAERTLSAGRLAEFHGVPPAYLAKHLQAMAQAGIVEATAGRSGGYRLARRPEEITVLDVLDAVDGGEPAFRCTEIRRRGPARVGASGYALPCGIASTMQRAEDAYRAELATVTIADLLARTVESISPVAIRKTANWMQEVLR